MRRGKRRGWLLKATVRADMKDDVAYGERQGWRARFAKKSAHVSTRQFKSRGGWIRLLVSIPKVLVMVLLCLVFWGTTRSTVSRTGGRDQRLSGHGLLWGREWEDRGVIVGHSGGLIRVWDEATGGGSLNTTSITIVAGGDGAQRARWKRGVAVLLHGCRLGWVELVRCDDARGRGRWGQDRGALMGGAGFGIVGKWWRRRRLWHLLLLAEAVQVGLQGGSVGCTTVTRRVTRIPTTIVVAEVWVKSVPTYVHCHWWYYCRGLRVFSTRGNAWTAPIAQYHILWTTTITFKIQVIMSTLLRIVHNIFHRG